MSSALLEELKTVASQVKRSQIEDAVGASWAALAAEYDDQERGIRTLLATQSEGENEFRHTNRSVRGVCLGVVHRVHSKLSRTLHAHGGNKLLQDLENPDNTTMKRASVRFRGAREKGAMAFVECLGSRKKTQWRPPCGRRP